jgi:hypothetical protein
MQIIIEIRPQGSCGRCLKPDVEPIFPNKEHALLYATGRKRSRSGEIRILDANGSIEKVIPFSASADAT